MGGALVLLLLAVAGLHWFQPWKAFTSRTIIEATPADATVFASGAFVPHEHPTSGTVELVQLRDGRFQVVLVDLSSSDGPDLRLWLSERELKSGRNYDRSPWVDVGPLKGTHGTHVYDVPAGTDVTRFRTITIWCKRFNTSFGAAPLTPPR